MLATRVGAGIAAEIGSMVVTEQVDALRMCAADPIDFLLVPRFLASMVMTTALIVWAGVIAFVAGMLTANVAFDVPIRTFCDMQLIDWGDLTTGLAKCVAYGAAIPIVSGVLRPLDVRGQRGRRLGDDAGGGELVAGDHRPQRVHLDVEPAGLRREVGGSFARDLRPVTRYLGPVTAYLRSVGPYLRAVTAYLRSVGPHLRSVRPDPGQDRRGPSHGGP